MSDSEQTADIPVSVDVDIDNGRTIIEATGDRDAAVIVESRSGERIYLPPEDFKRPPDSAGEGGSAHSDSPYQSADSDSPYQAADSDSPYQSADSDSPYQPAEESDSPYQSGESQTQTDRMGLSPTGDGFRIVHPEPVTDVRVLR